MTNPVALAVVVVTHNSAESLPALLDTVLPQLGSDDELVIFDNASRDATIATAQLAGDRAQIVESPTNLGFGAGCHIGVRRTRAPLVLFLNPDCQLGPCCLDRLRSAAHDRPAWGAWQAAVLLADGRINTDGGVVHFLGFGWAGDCGKPIAWLPPELTDIDFPSGAAMVVRRSVWQALDGLDPSYFLYSEDLDLGLRLWLTGYGVGIVPDATVIHDYEFDKGPGKWYWLERNRWRTILSVYPLPLLLMLAPALLAAEVALLLVAARDGWLRAKLRAQAAAVMGLPGTLRRRRGLQAMRSITASAFSGHLTASVDSLYMPIDNRHWAAQIQSGYWRVVKRVLAATRS